MKKLFLVLGCIFAASEARSQTNAQWVYVTVAPSGACQARANLRLLTPNGTLYTCVSGTWAVAGGGGGGTGTVTSVSGTANQIGVATGTTTPVISLVTNTAIPGSPTTTTQSAGDSSTKVATTAFTATAISNAIAGVNPAVAVQACTTLASNTSGFTYNNGVAGVGATFTGSVNTAVTIDGYTFTALGQRLLVKNDTQSPSGAFNGVYYVTQIQTAILAPILTRALDYNMPSDINNTGTIPCVNGTVNASTSWLLTSSVTTVGTDPLTYTQFSIAPTTVATKIGVQAGGYSYCSSSSTANTYTCTLTPTLTAYTAGMCVILNVTNANTSSSTLNIDSLGAKAINTSNNVAIGAGAITALALYQVCYDGTEFLMPQDTTGPGGVTTVTLTGSNALNGKYFFQKLTLSGNVTISSITNIKAGIYAFVICQNATGNFTYTWPASVIGGMTIGLTASECNTQNFDSDGTTLYASTPGVINE